MRISVVIPTFNGGGEVSRLLESLARQTPVRAAEIVAIDSGSRDDTQARIEAAGGRFVPLKAPFDHGLARDAGIAAATGKLVFLTVQDACLAAPDCLARFARHFVDPAVAGVSSRQIPPPDGPAELQIKAALEARAAEPVAVVRLADHPNYGGYTAERKVELYRFDNVGAMLRRSVWERLPFGACEYAEDLLWARRALEAGHALVRDFTAPLIHAHRRAFGYEFRRALLDARVMDEAFEYRYSLFRKLNRLPLLASPSAIKGGRGEALKTWTAHALARGVYTGYRWCLKPLGIGRQALLNYTRGI